MQKQANLLHLFSIESWLERKRLSIVISHHLSSSLVRVDNICEPCICATEDTFWPGASCPCTDRFPGQCTFFFFTTTNALDGGTLQLWKCLCASKTKRNAVYRTDPYCIPRFYGFISPTYIVNWWRIVRHNSIQFWYILIREWSYAGISHDQSTPGDVFPSPNTQKNDDYEPSMWNSFFPKLIRDQHESQVDITGSPCHLACSSLSIVFKSKE